MPKTINQLFPILQKPQAGDLMVFETPQGTRKVDFAMLLEWFRLKLHFHKAAFDGETEVLVPGLETSSQVLVIYSMQPLEMWGGLLAEMPSGFFQPVYGENKIILKDGMYKDEKLLVIHN